MHEVQARAKEQLRRLCDSILTYLAHPDIIEIMSNPDGQIWVERLAHEMKAVDTLPSGRTQAIIERATSYDRREVNTPRLLFKVSWPLDNHAFIAEMVSIARAKRIVILEDLPKRPCTTAHQVPRVTSANITLAELLKATLGIHPNQVLVGEVRGAEALNLALTWNTGHSVGLAIIHANSAALRSNCLDMLISMAPHKPEHLSSFIGKVVDIILHIPKSPPPSPRKITEILRGHGYKNQRDLIESAL